jgi:hypothetical protein
VPLKTRWIVVVVAVVAAAAAVAVAVALRTSSPHGVVTDAADVASEYADYLEARHPKRGRVQPGAGCLRTPKAYRGAPVFLCHAAQRSSRGINANLDCVVSTRDGVLTGEDRLAGWPCEDFPR